MGEVYNDSSDWRHFAKCRDEDPELFFPIGSTGPSLLQIESAQEVCQNCPVRYECLEFALTTNMAEFGVWGGMSEQERRDLKTGPDHPEKIDNALAEVAMQQLVESVLPKQG